MIIAGLLKMVDLALKWMYYHTFSQSVYFTCVSLFENNALPLSLISICLITLHEISWNMFLRKDYI